MEAKGMIERALEREMLRALEWREGGDGLEAVVEGTWAPTEDDDERGLATGDEGQLTACVVGSEDYANQRVCFIFTTKWTDGVEVRPGADVEEIR